MGPAIWPVKTLTVFFFFIRRLQKCTIKVQLTPKIFFRLYKSPCFSDHRCEKIIVVAILVNFLWFFKVPKFAVSVSHGRAIAKNGAIWPVMSSKDYQCFAHEKNVCEHAIVWFKNVLLEGKAAQKAQERDILFLRYLYNDGTRPETRKRQQRCAGLCEVGPKQGAIKQFFYLGFPTTVKT